MRIPFKKILGKIHLWLGLTAGLVVFISLTAAAVFVWDKELTDWYHKEKIFVPEVRAERLPFNILLESARKAARGHSVSYVTLSREPERAYVFLNYKEAKEPGWLYASSIENYEQIYVDPYTGKVLGVVDLPRDWIFNTRMLHQCLLLNYDIGHYIVGGATLIIFVMIITGIVLWWPKNKAALKQRLWFKWKSSTKWKRKNYDLHNIGGIYTFLFVLLFAATGLVWTFDWWTNGIYRLLGNEPSKVFTRAPKPATVADSVAHIYDRVFADAMHRVPNWRLAGFTIPEPGAKEPREIQAFIRYYSGTSGWDESDIYAYHPKTGALYFSTPHDKKTLGAKWRNSNYAIHVGSIYGLPTKILACFIALYCASLPVSGFLIWWGRRKKKPQAPVKKAGVLARNTAVS
ncbi:PepSY-associated TM helix domain-containing protein [Chitinophaga sp. YIM B06452]|uniref:PepSY-associated TM helix domain-containing protein n=1 Tax=Chitinophaga sp. YIM B06452 TaxID=3082158 RepID=UPI0031FE8A02